MAVNDVALDNSIKIYPNPVKDKIFLKNFKNISKINIYDFSGKLLKTQNKNNENIDVSNLKAGEYILEMISDKTIRTQFIKQ